MVTTTCASGKFQDRRSRVVIGTLPDDFLRPANGVRPYHEQPNQCQQEMDRQLAMKLQHQQESFVLTNRQHFSQSCAGQLIVTVVEASLVKNYGMTRMDPYARLRIGHTVYETHASISGGRTPRWNKRMTCYLPHGLQSISVELYDERALTMDELIAYSQIQIPAAVFHGESADEWFQLSGKQGENKEGSIRLVFTLLPITTNPLMHPSSMRRASVYSGHSLGEPSVIPIGQVPVETPVVVSGYSVPAFASVGPVPNTVPLPVASSDTIQSGQQPCLAATYPQPPPLTFSALTEEEMREIRTMFPSLDEQVIHSVIDACGGRRDAIVDSLLQISGN